MVNLKELIEYCRNLADHPSPCGDANSIIDGRIPGIHSFTVDTVDAEVGKKYQGLEKDKLPVLGLILPTAISTSEDLDSITERNTVVLFVVDKFDPQRKDAVQTCVETQPLIEAIKATMASDKAAGCHLLDRLDLASLSTMPETGLYGTLAGWSLGFNFETVDFSCE